MNTLRERIKHILREGNGELAISLYLPISGQTSANTILSSLIHEYKINKDVILDGQKDGIRPVLDDIKMHIGDKVRGLSGKTFVQFRTESRIIAEFVLQKQLPPLLVVDRVFNVVPMADYLSQKQETLVLLLERERAKILEYSFDELKPVSELVGVVPQKVRRGSGNWLGFMSDPNEHRIDRHTRWHLRQFFDQVSNYVFNLLNRGRFTAYDQVILGVHRELLAPARESMHKYLKEKLVAHFEADLDEPIESIREKVVKSHEDYAKESEENILEVIENNQGNKNLAVTGIEEVKKQLVLGSVQTLVLNADGDLDLFEKNSALQKALDQDANIKVIKYRQEQNPTGVSAILRFKPNLS